MVVENPLKNEQDIKIIESFEPQPHKLGKLYKATLDNSVVLYRKISLITIYRGKNKAIIINISIMPL